MLADSTHEHDRSIHTGSKGNQFKTTSGCDQLSTLGHVALYDSCSLYHYLPLQEVLDPQGLQSLASSATDGTRLPPALPSVRHA